MSKCEEVREKALRALISRGYITFKALREIVGPRCTIAAYNFLLKSGLAVKVEKGLLVSILTSPDTGKHILSDLKAAIELCKGRGNCVFELLRSSASEVDKIIKILYKANTIKIRGAEPIHIQLWLEHGWPSEVQSEKIQGNIAKYFSFAGPKAVMLYPPWATDNAVIEIG